MTPGQGLGSRLPPTRAATRLSRQARSRLANKGLLPLAWESLLWLSIVPLVTGCIVADPPQYQDALQTPPQLDVYGALPTISQIDVITTPAPVGPTFTVPVRSEDAGEDLNAVFFLDYGSASPQPLNIQTVSASTFNDTGRSISWSWTVGTQYSHCHTISLVVAHRSSFQLHDSTQLIATKAKLDAAIVTWWVNINPPSDAQYSLVNCPTPQVPQIGAP